MRPTEAELAILRILWQHEPCTVRDIHERLENKEVRYTTTLKQLQVMLDKGLVSRDDTSRSHLYTSAVSEAEAQNNLLDHLLQHAFGGSTSKLFVRALDKRPLSPNELKALKALIEARESGE